MGAVDEAHVDEADGARNSSGRGRPFQGASPSLAHSASVCLKGKSLGICGMGAGAGLQTQGFSLSGA